MAMWKRPESFLNNSEYEQNMRLKSSNGVQMVLMAWGPHFEQQRLEGLAQIHWRGRDRIWITNEQKQDLKPGFSADCEGFFYLSNWERIYREGSPEKDPWKIPRESSPHS